MAAAVGFDCSNGGGSGWLTPTFTITPFSLSSNTIAFKLSILDNKCSLLNDAKSDLNDNSAKSHRCSNPVFSCGIVGLLEVAVAAAAVGGGCEGADDSVRTDAPRCCFLSRSCGVMEGGRELGSELGSEPGARELPWSWWLMLLVLWLLFHPSLGGKEGGAVVGADGGCSGGSRCDPLLLDGPLRWYSSWRPLS